MSIVYASQQQTITTYNGWSNRETWLVSLWLNNEPVLYSQLTEALRRNEMPSLQAEWLCERVQEQLAWHLEESDASLWVDMLNTAFYRVDWVEVIEKNAG